VFAGFYVPYGIFGQYNSVRKENDIFQILGLVLSGYTMQGNGIPIKNKSVFIVLVVILICLIFTSTRELCMPYIMEAESNDHDPNEHSSHRESRISKFQLSDIFLKEHRRIDKENILTRCARYGLTPYQGQPRRIFFGTLIADDNWDVIHAHAIEVYDVYHVAVYVESNTTHVASPRKLRFKDSQEADLLLRSEMFGPKTRVYIDFWLEDWPDLKLMNRESEQRNVVLQRWKKEGMTQDDVGIMADGDEFMSRDFLRAIQVCDFPALQPEPSCHRPKVAPLSISFEISPFCIRKRLWFHPDAIRGECVDGIGDPTERIIPLRTHQRKYGERDESYGRDKIDSYPEQVRKSNRYPLFTGPDIRVVQGDWLNPFTFKDQPEDAENAIYGAAYHFHNWFENFSTLRNKYATYAHGLAESRRKPLSLVADDIDISVRCAKHIGNDANPKDSAPPYFLEGRKIKGPKPIFFLNKTYLEWRHNLLLELLRKDEEQYGSCYDANGKWIPENETKI
jgi:Glycosyltransferase family 17